MGLWTAFIVFGELIRLSAVRYAGGELGLLKWEQIHCAHQDLILGHEIPIHWKCIYLLRVVLLSGGIYMFQLLGVVIFYFIFQYSMIISLEEENYQLFLAKTIQNIKIMFLELFR